MKKLQQKNGDAQKKLSGREVRGVSPEAGRESLVGKICERRMQRYATCWPSELEKDGYGFCMFHKIANVVL